MSVVIPRRPLVLGLMFPMSGSADLAAPNPAHVAPDFVAPKTLKCRPVYFCVFCTPGAGRFTLSSSLPWT